MFTNVVYFWFIYVERCRNADDNQDLEFNYAYLVKRYCVFRSKRNPARDFARGTKNPQNSCPFSHFSSYLQWLSL